MCIFNTIVTFGIKKMVSDGQGSCFQEITLFNAKFEGSKITRFAYKFSAVRPGSKRVRNLFQVWYEGMRV